MAEEFVCGGCGRVYETEYDLDQHECHIIQGGVPYAKRIVDDDGCWYAICPDCREGIELTERKDFESFTGSEYADHYEREHGGGAR